MSFVFNFSLEAEECTEAGFVSSNNIKTYPEEAIQDVNREEVLSPEQQSVSSFQSLVICTDYNVYTICDVSIESEPSHSDLIPGIYGGGKKVWECSVDLAAYLFQHHHQLNVTLDSNILELGCGHGIPGITLLQCGYENVVFSDLNADVLQRVTWPNIVRNYAKGIQHARCLGGDWHALSTYFKEQERQFSLVVSAETLYSSQTCDEVRSVCEHHP